MLKRREATCESEFTITEADFPDFREIECCPILGIPFGWDNGRSLKANSPTIDRIDSTGGYTPDNTIIISHRANTLKNNGTAAEHRAVAYYMEGGGK